MNCIEMSVNWGIGGGVVSGGVLYGGNRYKSELNELDSVS